MGCYRNTPYGTVAGVMTHSYEELQAKVAEFIASRQEPFTQPFALESEFMDPYRDGKAIDRFRDLLLSYDTNKAAETL